jgi:Circadian oscillating protein COP23
MNVILVTLTCCMRGNIEALFIHLYLMKLSKFILALLVVSSAIGMSQSFDSPALAGSARFYCGTSDNVPVTKVRSSRGDEVLLRWKNSYKDFSATKRCQIVTEKLQQQFNRGRFVVTSNENVNGMPVVCAVSAVGDRCNADSILFTLPRGSSARAAAEQFESLRSAASIKAMELSGRQESYATVVDGNYYINLGQAIADITGESIQQPATPTSQQEDRF